MIDRLHIEPTTTLWAAALAIVLTLPYAARAQSWSLAPGSATTPPASAGCAPYSPDGDVFDTTSAVPLGPAGCGLGWPAAVPPGNVDAFSTGLTPLFFGLGLPLALPVAPAPGVSVLFSVDPNATGAAPGCVPAVPFFPPSVGSEAAALPAASDAAADIFVTAGNATTSLPGFDAMPHTQVADGDGTAALPLLLPPAPGAPLGLTEPSPGGDDMDAVDTTPVAVFDFSPPGGDGIPDVPVFFSVDTPTAAAGGYLPADVLTTALGAVPAVYCPPSALGLDSNGPGTDDIDGLIVLDVAGDGVYAPASGDAVLYSLAPGSSSVGSIDACMGVAIEPGDVLVDGFGLGAPGALCVLVPAENLAVWPLRTCGANPVTGLGGDNLDALDLIPGITLTTTTSTTSTTTSTTTTTTMPAPACGPDPRPGCHGALPARSQLQINDKAGDDRDRLTWKFNKGEAASATADFGDPISGSVEYHVCIYDLSASTQPLLDARVPAGGTCGGKSCWQATGSRGFKYRDASASADGVALIKLRSGPAGKPKLQIRARGAALSAIAPPLVLPALVQLVADHTTGGVSCWENVFTTALANAPGKLKAKGP